MDDEKTPRSMRTTLILDESLVAEAKRLSGIEDTVRLVREALRAMVARESARRLAKMGGVAAKAVAGRRRRVPRTIGANRGSK
jgi:hypothetical protein